MVACPSGFEWKAMKSPSGDQRGAPGFAPIEVIWLALDPSGSATQISDSPERFDTKVTRRPSGENAGIHSTLVEVSATAGGEEAFPPGAGVPTRQIFQSAKLRT